jgi:hypothetical protein
MTNEASAKTILRNAAYERMVQVAKGQLPKQESSRPQSRIRPASPRLAGAQN